MSVLFPNKFSVAGYTITPNQLLVAWSFLYLVMQKRAQSTAPVWDDKLIDLSNLLLQNETFRILLCDVINGKRPVEALQLQAPNDIKIKAREFAAHYDFFTGWIFDTLHGLDKSPIIGIHPDYGHINTMANTPQELQYDLRMAAGGGVTGQNPNAAPNGGTYDPESGHYVQAAPEATAEGLAAQPATSGDNNRNDPAAVGQPEVHTNQTGMNPPPVASGMGQL